MIKVELTRDQIEEIGGLIKEVHEKNNTEEELKKLVESNENSSLLEYLKNNFELLKESKFYETFNLSNPHFEERKLIEIREKNKVLYDELFKPGKGILSSKDKLKDPENAKIIERKFRNELKNLDLLEDINLMIEEKDKKQKEIIHKKLRDKLKKLSKEIVISSYSRELLKLKDIFDYDKLETIRHEVMVAYNISVCPYCQRNYITSYIDDIEEKTTADLDHFFPKSTYPYLALSLYNFVPSCQICNSRMKLAKEAINVVYPFEESFDELGAKFKIKDNKDIDFFLKSSETEFEVEISLGNVKPEKVKKSIDLFKLDKIYKVAHNKYIQDMLKNIQKEPSNRIKLLNNDLKELMEGFLTEEEKELRKIDKDVVLAPYRFKYKNGEPLGKLTKDILESYKIIENSVNNF